MDVTFKQFMGFTTPIKSRADYLLDEALGQIVNTLSKYIPLRTGARRNTILDIMADSEQQVPEIGYFWEWMNDTGFSIIDQLDKRLPDTEEVLGLLTYRKMVLEMDASNESIDIFLLSITEFLTSTAEFLAVYFETAATEMVFQNQEKIALPVHQKLGTKNHWEFTISSAPLGAELLLYLKKGIGKWIKQKQSKFLYFPKLQYR